MKLVEAIQKQAKLALEHEFPFLLGLWSPAQEDFEMFDTRRFVNKLTAAGMSEEQARGQANALEWALREAFGEAKDRAKRDTQASHRELTREMKDEFSKVRSDIQLLVFLSYVALFMLLLVIIVIPAD